MKRPDPRSPSIRPWHPTPYSVDDVYALQNLAKGTASDVQQKHVLDFIITRLCATYGPEFVPDSDRESAFASGKRHCGLALVKLLNMPRTVIEAMKLKEHGRRLNTENEHG